MALLPQIADAAGEIMESAMKLDPHRDAATSLSKKVNEYLSAIETEVADGEDCLGKCAGWRDALAGFHSILDESRACLSRLENKGSFAKAISLGTYKDRQKLAELSASLSDAFSALMLSARSEAVSQAESIATQAMERQDILTRLQAQTSEIARYSLRCSSSVLHDSPPLARLPLPPSIFHGRSAETQTVVESVTKTAPAYVAILGGPGMGKTSLALSVLHDPVIVNLFAEHRYFVPCDAVTGPGSGCLAVVASAFGVSGTSRRSLQHQLANHFAAHRSLVVLDNFESAWEAADGRLEAEEALQFLSGLDGLSLLVTLRGTERPHGVAWSHPFLPPLEPLSDEAAMQVFASMSDVDADAMPVRVLLRCIGNVPLAIILMATLVQYEPPTSLLQRWETYSTAMLYVGQGTHRLNSLDVSIAISFHSARMSAVPGAAQVLSILALLPDGVRALDLSSWSLPIADVFRAITTLQQTALAYRTLQGRIRVLAPIRAFMLAHHSPSDDLVRPLCDYFFGLVSNLNDTEKATMPMFITAPAAIAAVELEVGNITSVIGYALRHSSDPYPAVTAAAYMCKLLCNTGIGSPDLLHLALSTAKAACFEERTANLLHTWAAISGLSEVEGDVEALLREARSRYERIGNVDGIIDTTLDLLPCWSVQEAIETCVAMRKLAEEEGDVRRTARAWQCLGSVHDRVGHYDLLKTCCRKAIETLEIAGIADARIRGYCLSRIARTHIAAGGYGLGVEMLRDALPLQRAARHTLGVGDTARCIGAMLLRQGNPREAIDYLSQALDAYQRGGYIHSEIGCLSRLCHAHLANGDQDTAATTYNRANERMRRAGISSASCRATLLHMRGNVAMECGDLEEATASLVGARRAYREPDIAIYPEMMLHGEAQTIRSIGRVQNLQGDGDGAVGAFLLAAVIFRSAANQSSTVRVLVSVAQACHADIAEPLLQAVIPPLHRFGFRPALAAAVLRSAELAQSREDLGMRAAEGQVGHSSGTDILDKVQGPA